MKIYANFDVTIQCKRIEKLC